MQTAFRHRSPTAVDCAATSVQRNNEKSGGRSNSGRTFVKTPFSLMKPISQLKRSLRPVICHPKSWFRLTTSGSARLLRGSFAYLRESRRTGLQHSRTEVLGGLHQALLVHIGREAEMEWILKSPGIRSCSESRQNYAYFSV
jgi:hypothetical protein